MVIFAKLQTIEFKSKNPDEVFCRIEDIDELISRPFVFERRTSSTDIGIHFAVSVKTEWKRT